MMIPQHNSIESDPASSVGDETETVCHSPVILANPMVPPPPLPHQQQQQPILLSPAHTETAPPTPDIPESKSTYYKQTL